MVKAIGSNSPLWGVQRMLSAVAGSVLIAIPFLLQTLLAENLPPLVEIPLVLSGCALAVLGIASRSQRLTTFFAKASLAILSATVVLALSEVTFRIVRFDFDRFGRPSDEVPIYYRRATLHAGEGIFRRPGPASWQGQVLSAYMRMQGASGDPYTNEEPVLAEYDALGFRNPMDLTDWEVVVTGDSFVELGYLPYEELFTTLAAKRLGVRIKNLGVSGTGPISQTFYVKNYGKAASTKDAVLCFFDGNDLEDLSRELRNVESFRKTGRSWDYRPQVSLIKAVCARLRLQRGAANFSAGGIAADGSPVSGDRKPIWGITPNATLVNGGRELPMTLYGKLPPVWDRMGPRQRNALLHALQDWAETVRANRMRPWIMYLPGNQPVFHGFIRYSTNAVVLEKPTEFDTHLGAACTNLGIGFINTLPALRQAAEAGHVPYNLIGDGHFSRDGSRIVADVLANALKSENGYR